MKYLFSIITIFLFSFFISHGDDTLVLSKPYLVTRVSDGDTFFIDNNSIAGLKIRLIGINAPESANVYDRKEEPYGKEAKAFVQELLLNKKVRLEFDKDSLDKYKRTLAYAYLPDSTLVNELILKEGWATVSTFRPNVKYVDRFLAAQRSAISAKKGLWK